MSRLAFAIRRSIAEQRKVMKHRGNAQGENLGISSGKTVEKRSVRRIHEIS
jgi:hypothetical protein